MGNFFHDRGEAPPERPADPEVRRANMRRIGRLFKPYWRRLSALLALIVVSAGLGVLPAFLLRRILIAIEAHDTRAVSVNAAAMIVIAIVAGILGVIQTLLSNQVAQRVMHDLRASVFRQLQRLSLAFFTRTRTGEVQSRINNDIGGVQNVVTNTATNITSSVTTVIATMIGMLVLSWQLALCILAVRTRFSVPRRGDERGLRSLGRARAEQLHVGAPLVLKVVERFTRVGPDQMRYEMTVDDPKTYVAPWTLRMTLTQQPGHVIYEYGCHEGNGAVRNSLSGERAFEQQVAEAKAKGEPVPQRTSGFGILSVNGRIRTPRPAAMRCAGPRRGQPSASDVLN